MALERWWRRLRRGASELARSRGTTNREGDSEEEPARRDADADADEAVGGPDPLDVSPGFKKKLAEALGLQPESSSDLFLRVSEDQSRRNLNIALEVIAPRQESSRAMKRAVRGIEVWSRQLSTVEHAFLCDEKGWRQVKSIARQQAAGVFHDHAAPQSGSTISPRASSSSAGVASTTWSRVEGAWGAPRLQRGAWRTTWQTVVVPKEAAPSCPSSQLPEEPVRPSFAWRWNNSTSRSGAQVSKGAAWVPYLSLQSGQIEAAFRRYVETGKEEGLVLDGTLTSDSKHVNPSSGRHEYRIDFSLSGKHVQVNVVSGFRRKVERVPVDTDDDLPPDYPRSMGQSTSSSASQTRAVLLSSSSSHVLHLVGFNGDMARVRAELERLLKKGIQESKSPIPLPDFLRVRELQNELGSILTQCSAELLVVASGSAVKVRAPGQLSLAQVESKVRTLILERSQWVPRQGWGSGLGLG